MSGLTAFPGATCRQYATAVIDAGADPGDTGAAELWDTRARLWERLIACELTEVFVASDLGLSVLLPQTLGLEPIYEGASYYMDGTPIPRAERVRSARKLAAQRFWLVHGDAARCWDRPFVERAQIALILLKPPWYRRLSRVLSSLRRAARDRLPSRRDRDDDGQGLAYDGIASEVKHDKTQAEFYKRVQAFRPDGPFANYSPTSTPTTTVAGKYLLERYPEKTVVVSGMAELRQLQALRIRRAWPDG